MKYLLPLALVILALTPAVASARAAGAGAGRLADHLGDADANGDGMVTRGELVAWRNGQFDRFDRNHDGALSVADLPALPGARQRFDEVRAICDADRDGRISRAEFISGPTPLFDRIDRDGNGVDDDLELAEARRAGR